MPHFVRPFLKERKPKSASPLGKRESLTHVSLDFTAKIGNRLDLPHDEVLRKKIIVAWCSKADPFEIKFSCPEKCKIKISKI